MLVFGNTSQLVKRYSTTWPFQHPAVVSTYFCCVCTFIVVAKFFYIYQMEEIQFFIIGLSEDEAPMNATAALHRAQYNLLPEVTSSLM